MLVFIYPDTRIDNIKWLFTSKMKYLSPRSISNHQIGFLLSYALYWPSFVSGINLRYFINKTWQASFTSVFPKIHLRDNAGKDHIFHFQVLLEKVMSASPRIGSKVTITECKNQKTWHFTGLLEQEKMIGGY